MSHCAEARTHGPAVIVARPSVVSFRKPSNSLDRLARATRANLIKINYRLHHGCNSSWRTCSYGSPNKLRRSSPMSPQCHSILILINAADDRAPSIQQTTPVHVHGGQRCAHSTSFDGYSATGSLARRGRGGPTSPVETASAGSDAVCRPTTTVSTEPNRSLAAQHRSGAGTCRSIDRRLKQVARMSEANGVAGFLHLTQCER